MCGGHHVRGGSMCGGDGAVTQAGGGSSFPEASLGFPEARSW